MKIGTNKELLYLLDSVKVNGKPEMLLNDIVDLKNDIYCLFFFKK